jgi:hypothetical protein
MKPQFQHKVSTSYLLWFENFFLKKSEAFFNETGTFTYYADDRLPDDYHAFGSQYKQLVYDASIPNAYIPSGVYISGTFTQFDSSNYILDYENGRFIGKSVPTGSVVSGAFSPKTINVYFTNDTEENIVLNVQEKINQSVVNKHEFYAPYQQKLPAIYLSNDTALNKPFAFGGFNETQMKSKAIAIANNSYELDTILSIFADSYNELIPICDFDSHPLNEFGALKTGYYSYEDIKKNYKDHLFVKDVIVSKLSDKLKQNLLKDLYIGFIDFTLSTFRYRS